MVFPEPNDSLGKKEALHWVQRGPGVLMKRLISGRFVKGRFIKGRFINEVLITHSCRGGERRRRRSPKGDFRWRGRRCGAGMVRNPTENP